MKDLKNEIKQAKCTISKLTTEAWKILSLKESQIVDRLYIANRIREIRNQIWEIISHFERYYKVQIIQVRRVY